MREIRYERALNLKDALAAVGKEKRRPLAGGTDLLLKIKHGMAGPAPLLDISRIEELRYIRWEVGQIRIGACTKLSELFESDLLRKNARLLLDVAREIGSTEVRNMGTIGGNLCCARANCGACFLPGCRGMTSDRSALPCRNAVYADILLPMAAYDATFTLKCAGGERTVSARDFIAANGSLDLKPDEIMTEIAFDRPERAGWGYARLRQPESMGLPFVCVIAEMHGDVFDLTIGGSVKGLRRFEAWSPQDGTEPIVRGVDFNESLIFTPEYRRRSLASLIQEAARRAREGGGAQ